MKCLELCIRLLFLLALTRAPNIAENFKYHKSDLIFKIKKERDRGGERVHNSLTPLEHTRVNRLIIESSYISFKQKHIYLDMRYITKSQTYRISFIEH